MCAINPKRSAEFTFKLYTAHDVTDEYWNELVVEAVLEAELRVNENGAIRCHIEPKEQA